MRTNGSPMKFARIADRQAAEAVALLDDEVVCAVAEEEAMAAEVAEIDRLIDEVDQELAVQERTEQVRVSRAFTDQVRAQRSRRRADREVLRALPPRLPVPARFGREAA